MGWSSAGPRAGTVSAYPQLRGSTGWSVHACADRQHFLALRGWRASGAFRLLPRIQSDWLVMWTPASTISICGGGVRPGRSNPGARPQLSEAGVGAGAAGRFAWPISGRRARSAQSRPALLVRVINYTLTDPALPGCASPALADHLLRPERYPLLELSSCITPLEFELTVDEIETISA